MSFRLVIVQNLDEGLVRSYGEQMRVPMARAERGQRRGKWKILPGQLPEPDAMSSGGASGYLARDRFAMESAR